MALQGPFAVIADSPAPDVVEALRTAGAYPIVETGWTDAPAALTSIEPEAVVAADPCPDQPRADAIAKALAAQRVKGSGFYMPILVRTRDDGASPIAEALTIAAAMPAERIVGRLSAALRIRTLHSTVLRRIATLTARGEQIPELPTNDPLDEATVLIAGRGRTYPALSVAVGEQVGLVGALSVESAARALNVRDIDGMVIGDGFSPRIVEALLTVLAEDVRFRDLPVIVLGSHPGIIEPFAAHLPNLDRISEGPQRLVERFLPYVRQHALGERLKRMLKSLDAQGMLDPDTGLLGHEAFWRDLNRAVGDAEKRGVGLTIARFSFGGGDRRLSLDAARLVGRLMRQVDFACREADNSIFAVFTETDLRAAHVVARRIASILKNTMLSPDRRRDKIDAAVTLATLKPTDSVDSLIARVVGEVAAG
ncbi:MAG TPA: GGDEF domain-containing protein [Xanthobacteraceae bacterium]|nr:GGDEF domain-containing protein [Xanthobacteraceae bacterium]